MKITAFFTPTKSSTNKEEERLATQAIDNTEHLQESMSVSGSITVQTPKKRRERFSDPEIHKLIDTILQHIDQLFGPTPLSAASKAAIWDEVAREVNKVRDKERTTDECKKRWQDYKRKLKQIIDNFKRQGGEMATLLETFSRRQIMVAQFFKMDVSAEPIHEESSSDLGECVSSNPLLNPSYVIDSDDEIVPSQNKSLPSPTCLPSTSHQDKLISQSHEKSQMATKARDPHHSKTEDASIPQHAAKSQLQLETQVDQLVAQQKDIFEALESIQKNVTASLNIQNKMYNLVKGSFLELQKTLLSSQKASNDHSSVFDLRLNNLHTKLDEINSILQVKQLQDIMSSDESELSTSGTPDVRATPSTKNTATAICTPKKKTVKRRLDQDPSSIDFIKKAKQI
ncbi:uncharacterized protein RB166_010444 [Leptodactylus fuscus]|uniref:uncharacterized protein LOC142210554 n=1 Tax=Leptodactylus fuscus TaxID=238119 RepID=UPI003F4EB801